MYDPSPSAQPSSATGQLAPVLVTFAGPAPQRRGTVAIRLILVIPHIVCLWGLGIAAGIVAVIGWFGALFTGRLPDFAADFLGGVLHWQVRVLAYMSLLTDEYPPFALGDAPYPVRIAYQPGPLNRLAVLFRYFLALPAAVVLGLLQAGVYPLVGFATWLILLFTGTMPEQLYEALAAVIRYSARYSGYYWMLTSAYPGGLFGDQPAALPAAGFAQPALGEPSFGEPGPGFAQSGFAQSGFGQSGVVDQPEPGFVAPGAGFAAPVPATSAWSLILSSGARTLVGVFIGIGVIVMGVGIASPLALVGNVVSKVNAINQTQLAFLPLGQALNSDNTAVNACGSDVSCVSKLMGPLGDQYGSFADTLAAISMPSGAASSARDAVVADARKLSSDYHQLGGTTTADQFNGLAGTAQNDARKFAADVATLSSALGTGLNGA